MIDRWDIFGESGDMSSIFTLSLWSYPQLTTSSTSSCMQPGRRRRLRPRAAGVRWRCQCTQHLNRREGLQWTAETLMQGYRKQTEVRQLDGGVFLCYPSACPLVRVSGWRETASPSRGNGSPSIPENICDVEIRSMIDTKTLGGGNLSFKLYLFSTFHRSKWLRVICRW